jgi:hypothetical protein
VGKLGQEHGVTGKRLFAMQAFLLVGISRLHPAISDLSPRFTWPHIELAAMPER